MVRKTGVALVVVGALLFAPAAADASFSPFASTRVEVTGLDAGSVAGQVSSSSSRCLRSRTIRVTSAAGGPIIARATTDRGGRFAFALPPGASEETTYRIRVPLRLNLPICLPAYADLGFDYATLSGGAHDGAFSGVLFSSVPACEPGRVITLYEISSDPTPVGWAPADANGGWRISSSSGTYEVRAEQTVVADGKRYVVCSEAVSFPWSYEEPTEPEPEPEP